MVPHRIAARLRAVGTLRFHIDDVPATHILTAKAVTTQERIGDDVGRLFASLFGAAAGRGTGAPLCIYPEGYDPERIVLVAALPFDGAAPYGFDTTDLPAGRALVGTYVGSYEGLPDAWRETFAHLEEEGLELGSAPYERYVADPGHTPPERLETEIVIPLR